MGDILTGFATVWVVIAVGFLLAHAGVLDETAQRVLGKVSFTIGTPALLFTLMSRAELARIFSHGLIASLVAIGVSGLAYVLVARLVWKPDAGHLVVGAFASCYVNSNNLGLPIAIYVVHDPAAVLPILLVQLCFLQPLGLTVLDIIRARQTRQAVPLWWNLSLPLRNPMTVATLLGLLVNALRLDLPRAVTEPISLAGGLAVPTMLIAFGISLRLGPTPSVGPQLQETLTVSLLKLVFMPAVGFLAARALGLDPATTFAVTVMAGLPTANNVFLIAMMYGKGVVLARDTNFVTSLASIATITVIAALIGTG